MFLSQWFMYNAFGNMKRSFQRGIDLYDPLLTTVDKVIERTRSLRDQVDYTQKLGSFLRNHSSGNKTRKLFEEWGKDTYFHSSSTK